MTQPTPHSNPSGMCNQCIAYAGSVTVKLCPLHAQAGALREALEHLLSRYDKVGGPLAVGLAVDKARGLLAATKP